MIAQDITDSFLFDLMQNIVNDVFRIALYTADAQLTRATRVYTTDNEVVGQGYGAGGLILTGTRALLEGGVAMLDWDDPVWPNASITARAAMIYNASRGNHAVAVLDLGKNFTSTNGNFLVPFPEVTPSTCLVRIV